MAQEWGSSSPYTLQSINDLRNVIGIPQFGGAAGEQWVFVLNGLTFQGGIITVPAAVTVFPFNIAFPQQVLGVIIQSTSKGHSPGVTTTTLSTFTVDHSGGSHTAYWIAVGV